MKKVKKNPAVMAGFFVCFHIIAVLWWVTPQDTSLKRLTQHTFVGRIFTDYMHLTGTSQSWRMFAPNPSQVDRQILVYAVKTISSQNGDHPATPVYDATPVYMSSPLKSFWYENDTRMAFFLTSTQAQVFLKPFAEYWGHVYEKRTGHLPVEIDVVFREGRIPPLFSSDGTSVVETEPTYRKQVLWQTKF